MIDAPDEWWSHPPEDGEERVLLEDHLEDVADRVEDVVPETAETPAGESLRDVVRLLARVHDFGKLTTWFQQYVRPEERDPPRKQLRYHSQLGALLGYYVLNANGYDFETCLAGYVAVAKHHQPLPNVTDYVFEQTGPESNRNPRLDAPTMPTFEDYSPGDVGAEVDFRIVQANNVAENAPEVATDLVGELTDGTGEWDDFLSDLQDSVLFENVSDPIAEGGTPKRIKTDAVSADFYACLLQTWSALVFADKTSAANASREGYEPEIPSRDALECHVECLPSATGEDEAELNDLRGQARQEVLDNVKAFAGSDSSVATLTLPTGMGKTLTGLGGAMKLRDLTDRERIVYALPFTSIVDQVVDVLTGIEGFDTDGTGQVLTVDHHLAETVIELDEDSTEDDTGEETDADADVETMLGESWRSGMTVTTFVQLFESLAGPGNRQSMKLLALYDSVVVLDEPQALPQRWWALIRRLVDVLTEEYGATVIAMTATQPRLFEGSEELVDDRDEYFDSMDRVEYDLHESVLGFSDTVETVGYEAAAKSIVEAAESDGDVLAVCNTIDSAKELTGTVDDSLSDVVDVGDEYADLLGGEEAPSGEDVAEVVVEATDSVALLHLTTRIRPRDRRVLLDAAETLLDSDVTLVAVTTQLVEAGVDVSFDRGFRDFAPMDSIVQAAGRCNRSFERDLGRVTVWWLEAPEDKERTPSQAVYELWGDSLLSLTKQSLDAVRGRRTTLSERTLTVEGVDDYFEALSRRGPGKEDWVNLVDTAKAEDLSEKSLIEQRLAVDVVVCRTADERDRIEQVRSAWDRFDFDRVDELLDELRSVQVSVPIYTRDSPEAERVRKLDRIHGDSDIRWLDARTAEYDDFFDSRTGLMLPEDTVERRFL